jgi:hypothetical protein
MHENSENFEMFEDVSNPLDSVEDIMVSLDWSFDRPNPEEISARVSGRHGQYSLTFIWQEDYSAMQFFCEYDLEMPAARKHAAALALQTINARLWLGHFTVQEHNSVPCFRHTSMFRGCTHTSGAEHVEDLVDIALAECDRHFSVFSLLACPLGKNDGLLPLALSETAGEA